ncbi:MAG TPA: hypothetical protein VNA88_16430 [Candidatus Kapabacteria bacterium]|jgi:hypothetical protein|nr:hypothetical protein [Candidatus Kapabacteria bacterium]
MMLQSLGIVCALIGGATSQLCAQIVPPSDAGRGTARWIVEQLYSPDGFPDRAEYYAGEMSAYAERPSFGERLSSDDQTSYRELYSDDDHSVYAITISWSTGASDVYASLRKQPEGWKVLAMRSLALPPLYYHYRDTLAAQTELTLEERLTLARMRLATSSDATLREFARSNRSVLDSLVQQVVAGDTGSQPSLTFPWRLARSVDECERCVLVLIDGMIDNEVGFLYVPNPRDVPVMSPKRYILVEPIGGGWYLYKTT